MKKLLLIDGNSLMFRSYFATAAAGNIMKTRSGLHTNALFAFVNMMTKLLSDGTEYAFVAFDAGKETFRHREYAEYKGGRPPLPEELKVQIPLIKEYLGIIGVTGTETPEYEADDLLASVALRFRNDFDKTEIITGDRDLLQLVSKGISVCLTKKGVSELDIYTEANFFEKTGLTPSQIVDYKGIAGDNSDNLPGIKGVGDKGALALLSRYENLDDIYDHLEELSPQLRRKFTEGKETAYKCRRLAVLSGNAAPGIVFSDLKIRKEDTRSLIAFYTKVEFTSLLKKIGERDPIKPKSVFRRETDYRKIKGDSYIVPEVCGSDYYRGRFLGIGILNGENRYFLKPEEIFLIKDYLEDEKEKKYTFDYKKLCFLMKRKGIELKGTVFDLLIAAYLINPDYAADDFKIVAGNFGFAGDLPYVESVYGTKKGIVPEEEKYEAYAFMKCEELKAAKESISKRIREDGLEFLFEAEMNLSAVLAQMEYDGVNIDLRRLAEIGEEFQKKASQSEEVIFREAGHPFNINSPKQLGEVLFGEMRLPHGKKNKLGYSTNVAILEKLAADYRIARDILEYRTYTKLFSTYVKGMSDVSEHDCKRNLDLIHPIYKQALTATGRLSSVEPNIQNIPIRTENGQAIRKAFTSRFPDGVIVSSDYSQIELRVLADMSGDRKMIEAFNSHTDFHTRTAAEIFETTAENVTKDMRRTAKAINFGIIYGMSPWGLSETLGIGLQEAKMFIDKYFYNYSSARECLQRFVDEATEKGYSRTLYGRRRYIGELKEKNINLRSFGERTAMNSPIQGTAADIMKIAMNKVHDVLKKNNLKTVMIAQVHDELVFDVPADEKEIVMKLVGETMEQAVKLAVPLEAGIAAGKNWFEAK